MKCFDLSTISAGEMVCLHATDKYEGLAFGETTICFSKPIICLTVGKKYVVVICTDAVSSFLTPPKNVMVYSLDGEYLWDLEGLVTIETTYPRYFIYVTAHTKETLTQQQNWRVLFGSCTLEDDHEYLTAYDGGEEWLFDLTDRKFIKRVFTH